MPNKLSQFWQELKRRNVVRVITVYAGVAFVILELVDMVREPFELPNWSFKLVIIILSIGFIIIVIVSWIYDIQPERGVVKTEPADKIKAEDIPKTSSSWKIASYISFAVIVGLILFHILSSRENLNDQAALKKTIAVLPFDNMSDAAEFAYFGDAMTDEIIMQLCKINSFFVRSRTSIMQYKGTQKTMPVIGQELQANYLLEGSAQRFEDRVRIRVQLIQAQSDNHIWGDVYEGEWKDILSLQVEIARQVAEELKTVLSPEEIRKIEKHPTENLKAYNLYLKGRYFWNKRTAEGFQQGIEYFLQAIEEDPAYSLAYAGIADCYNLLGWHDILPPGEVHPRAKAAAEKALLIDETLSQAHASLAYVEMQYYWDWQAADIEFNRALELNPNYAEAHQWYSEYLAYMGRHTESITEAKRAQELDPLSLSINHNLGLIFYEAHEFDSAIKEYQNTLQTDSNFIVTYNYLGLAYAGAKMYKKAIINVQTAIDLTSKQSPLYIGTLGFIYASMGNTDEARKVLEHLLELSQTRYIAPVSLAIIYGALGLKDQAFEWMEKGFEVRDDFMMTLKVEPRLDNLRSDPRYQDLIDRMNFPD